MRDDMLAYLRDPGGIDPAQIGQRFDLDARPDLDLAALVQVQDLVLHLNDGVTLQTLHRGARAFDMFFIVEERGDIADDMIAHQLYFLDVAEDHALVAKRCGQSSKGARDIGYFETDLTN